MKRIPGDSYAWLSPVYNHSENNTSFQNKNTSNEFADEWDRIGLKSILRGKHKNLFKKRSEYQNIHIVEARDIRLYLNEQLQFSSLDERIYHEALVHPAFHLTRSRKRVLIAGGGDGLALREVLKHKDVKHVDLVDLDAEVLKAAKNNRSLADLNDYSLHDSRVKLHAADAVQFLSSNQNSYHIIIVDFPDPTDRIISNLYTTEFFSLVKRSLSKDGLFVCQSNSPEDTPIVFWSIAKTMESVGFGTLSYHTIVPSFGDWGFHIGSIIPLQWSENHSKVQHHQLPTNLSDMFYFPDSMLHYKSEAIINTKKRSVLHNIFKKEIQDFS
jgi:spermidine synthase